MNTKQFHVGQVYGTRSIGDQNCVFRFLILRRTAKTVWIREADAGHGGKVSRKRITFDGIESIKPLGDFSMCPVLKSDRNEDGDRR